MQPIVKVIGYTKFLGVPDDLGKPNVDQDSGSDAARLIECAGRTCYDSFGKGRDSAAYHKHILEVGHGSVLEHSTINFFISGVSRGLTHELVRHRAGTAISQRSTRYVDENNSDWVLHPLLEKFMLEADKPVTANNGELVNPSVNMQCGNATFICKNTYRLIVEKMEAWLITSGVDKFTARKQARGAARGILGNALMTELVWSANIRALRNVIEQRASAAADAEIRVLANRLYEESIKVAPEFFSDYERIECPDGIGYGLTTKFRKV